MDNWVTFLLVNVVLVIVLGILTNLATPWVKSAYDKSIFSSRQKRIKTIIEDYRYTKALRINREYAIIVLIGKVVRGLIYVVLLIAYIGSNIFLFMVPSQHSSLSYTFRATVVLIVGAFVYFQLNGIANEAYSMTGGFEKYREKTIAKLIKLGGNPEDLDKE